MHMWLSSHSNIRPEQTVDAFEATFGVIPDGFIAYSCGFDMPSNGWQLFGLDPLPRDWSASFKHWIGYDNVINGMFVVASDATFDERDSNDAEIWVVEQWHNYRPTDIEPQQIRFFL